VIAAAGRGARTGLPGNKAFLSLRGRPLVSYALEALRACPEVGEIVLVVAPEDVERARRSLIRREDERTERVVAGGADRQASVRAALAEVSPTCDLVLVHDGARPLLSPALVRRCLEAARLHGAAVSALPASDTVKEVDSEGRVRATLDRSRLWLVQTPQAFRRDLLAAAHEAAAREGVLGTDDAYLVERLGRPVQVVLGDRHNVKVTYPEDLLWCEEFLRQGRKDGQRRMATRSGIGYDAHPLTEGRPLVLAGVRIPSERGLLGHSDADVVCHAVSDALLGAAAAGDIGEHFPASDPRHAGVSSLSLLAQVSAMVRARGWEIENVDAVIIADAPPLGGHLPEMRRALASAMDVDLARVSAKAKRTEGLGFTGRGEGIASQAICLLRRTTRRGRDRAVRGERC